MVKVLSIDVGIKNLSVCCIEKDCEGKISILLWENYNLLDGEDHSCETLKKSGEICGKKCSYKDTEGIFSCKTHCSKVLKSSKLKKTQVKTLLLQEIALLVSDKIEEIYTANETIHDTTKIVIELQPRINQKMKFISHIVFGKFVSLYKRDAIIRFVSASKKFRFSKEFYETEECKKYNLKLYSHRKKISIAHAKWFVKTKLCSEELYDKLDKCSKADDLSDTLSFCLREI